MNRRLIIKTVLLCSGVFLLLTAVGLWIGTKFIRIDTSRDVNVLVASFDIGRGEQITPDMLGYKTIKEPDLSPTMLLDFGDAVGKYSVIHITEGDYIRKSDLEDAASRFKHDERIRLLPLDIVGRQVNLVRKGSLVDIKVRLKDAKAVPKVVLSRVEIIDIIDENGMSISGGGGSKTAYAVLILNKEQRDRLDVAMDMGYVFCELYGSSLQPPASEDFTIPSVYLESKTD